MAFKTGKESYYDRRLRELEKQSRAVRSDIRTIEKALGKPEDLASLGKLKFARVSSSASPASGKKEPAPSSSAPLAQYPQAQASDAQDLFSWGPRKSIRPRAAPPAQADAGKSKTPVAGDERFANYFSSGNFIASKPLRGETNVQRNKAIFMLLLLVLVGIWVVSMISRYL